MNSNFSGAYFVSDKFYSNSILVYICDYLGNRNCLVASVYAEEIRKNPPPTHTHTTKPYTMIHKCKHINACYEILIFFFIKSWKTN